MNWFFPLYLFLEVCAILITAWLIIYAWRHRKSRNAMIFGLMMLSLIIWSLTDLFFWISQDTLARIFWIKVQYIGIVSLPLTFFLFALQYTNRDQWLSLKWIAILGIIPLLTLLIAWTNQMHHLLWADMRFYPVDDWVAVEMIYGPWILVHSIYSYLLIFLGSLMILLAVYRSIHVYRGQGITILIGVVAPWLSNIYYLFKLGPEPHIDLTTIAFTLTGMVLAWSFFRYKLLDVMPVARHILFDRMDDGIVVLDAQRRIVDVNPSAEAIIQLPQQDCLGKRFESLFNVHPNVLQAIEQGKETQIEMVIEKEGEHHYYETRFLHLADSERGLGGSIVILHDFTKRRKAEAELQNYRYHLQEMVAARTAELTQTNILLQNEVRERERVEQALVESETRYRMISELMSDYAYALRVDREERLAFDWLTDSFSRITGYSFDELIQLGGGFTQIIYPEDRELAARRHERLFSNLPDVSEIRLITKDGTIRWLRDHARPVWSDSENRVTHIYGAARDITEHKQFEISLQVQYEIARLLTEANSLEGAMFGILQTICEGLYLDIGMVWQLDEQANLLWCIETWHSSQFDEDIISEVRREITFTPGWGLVGQTWVSAQLTWKADMQQEDVVDRYFAEKLGLRGGIAFPVRRKGVISEIFMFASRDVFTSNKDVLAVYSALMNQIDLFVERTVITEELRQSEERMAAFLNAIPDMIFRLSREGHFLDYRLRGDESALITSKIHVGCHLSDVFPPDIAYTIWNHIQQTLESDQIQIFEFQLPLEDGVHSFELRLVSSGKQEVLAIVRDVSERARLELMKSDFINRASHELRTPLTTAILTADLIQDGGSAEELEEYWQILRTELERQKILVERLLTVGRLESGTFQLNPGPVDVIPILRSALASVVPLAEARSITIEEELDEDLPLVIGDDGALQQVFINLLNNAVKFSNDGGKILISAARKLVKEREEVVAIQVRDYGIGIPTEDLPYLFTRFFRASNAIAQEIPGSGMGLYIIKSIVDELGGQIQVESKVGQGTVFAVWLRKSLVETAEYD